METKENFAGMSVAEMQIARSNRFVCITHMVEVIIISLAYILEFIKGARSIGYVLVTLLIGLAAPVLENVLYKRDQKSPMIKHLLGIGFGIFYTFICMTTNNILAFIYVVPLLVVITVYGDLSYCIKITSGVIVVNIIQIVVFLSNGTYTKDDMATIEIQILAMIIIAVYTLFSTKTIYANNQLQMEQIEEQGQQTAAMLQTTLEASSAMTETIGLVSNEMGSLSDTMEITKDAMNEVNKGSGDTADAIQKQLGMTENIQTKISDVTECADVIAQGIQDANIAVTEGSKNIETLVAKVNESVEAGGEVKDQLQELCNRMEQMNSVVEIINGITSQTSLLALNASIEAARAGEAGRGFAVVASEISGLASETDEATGQIHTMLQEFGDTINNVVEVTNSMITLISGQHDATDNTAKSFADIERSTERMEENSKRLEDNVGELSAANKEIVDSISTISAISEEVASHANNTLDISEKNIDVVTQVVGYTEKLKQLADQLQTK